MTDRISTKIPEVRAPRPVSGEPEGNLLIARMKERADLSAEAKLPRGPERRKAVYDDLVATAQRTQQGAAAMLDGLRQQGLVQRTESLWLPNAILVETAPGKHQAVADALRGVAEVSEVSHNKLFSVPTPVADAAAGAGAAAEPAPTGGVEWGVQMINAPAAWAKGFTGAGVTIGIVDTGLDTRHEAIAPHYRGTQADGSQVHDYNWFDPIGRRVAPYDDGQHGTHVGGSAGGGTETRQIGVAPGAKLIAAKAINGRGYNTTEATLKALQFMLAPTDVQGNNPNPLLGADVINNSWGNADRADRTFVDTWDGLLAAGIEVVTAAGNDGPRGKVSPPGSYPGAITVAATTKADQVAMFSSRGPSQFAPGVFLPNVAAPGSGITSAVPGNTYGGASGTSMASPHVAGAVALMLQAKPDATHAEIVEALEKTARDIDAPGPDHAAGYGRIDVDAAISHLTRARAHATQAQSSESGQA